jgi:hypothetical protein
MPSNNNKSNPAGWETLKSGSFQNGIWTATQYPTGWFFVAANHNTLGPYKTFQDGLVVWTKEYGTPAKTPKKK